MLTCLQQCKIKNVDINYLPLGDKEEKNKKPTEVQAVFKVFQIEDRIVLCPMHVGYLDAEP